jgi:hypothetical protein
MKPKKKTKVIKRWLANPDHTKNSELQGVVVEDLIEHFRNEWQSFLTLVGKAELEHELTVGLIAKCKKPHRKQLHAKEETNIFFDITDLMPHPDLFHTYATAAAQVPYYLLHHEWNGRVFATFNPYIWQNPTRCITAEVARFSLLAQLKAIDGLPTEVENELFDEVGLLHYNFTHHMGETLPLWNNPENDLIGWVSSPQPK